MRGVRRGPGPGPGRGRRMTSSPWAGTRCWRCAGGAAAGARACRCRCGRCSRRRPRPGWRRRPGAGDGGGAAEPDPGRGAGDHPGDAAAGRADRGGGRPGGRGGGRRGGERRRRLPAGPAAGGHVLPPPAGRRRTSADVYLGSFVLRFESRARLDGVPGRAAAGDRPARHLPDVGGLGGAAPSRCRWCGGTRGCRSPR